MDLRGAIGLCACSHVNKMHWNPKQYTQSLIPFYLFLRSFPSAMQCCEVCVWQGTCLCQTSAELVHPRSAALTTGKVHAGSLSFHLPSKYSRYTQRLWRWGMDLKPFPWRSWGRISNYIAIKPLKKELCFNQQFQPKYYHFKYVCLLIPFYLYKKGKGGSQGELGSTNCTKAFSLHCINEMNVVLIFILL